MFSVVIPAHNEENYIGNTIDKIKEAFFHGAPEEQYEIIVGDNASTDKTREICEVRGCKVSAKATTF